MSINIAIDGPAGAGKSTIARRVAASMNYIYVDTGAMYRAMALYMIINDVNTQQMDDVIQACEHIQIVIQYEDGEQCVYLNGQNVNGQIRTEEVSKMASQISAIPVVREKLLSLQRSLAECSDVIMDGRDIGTHVLPDADVKIFLTASVEIRAKRRYDEQIARNIQCNYEEIKQEIAERDHRDMTRAVAPLKQAEDAVLVDTSNLNIDEVVEQLHQIIEKKLNS